MPFSSVLGASSVIKPGVCTSTTRPTVPYEGQLIYETDTDRVAAYNGSAWAYMASGGTFTSYTPTWTNLTVGNATQVFRFCQIGKLVFVSGLLIWGSTTSANASSTTFSLPVTAQSAVFRGLGHAVFVDSGTQTYWGAVTMNSTTTATLNQYYVSTPWVVNSAVGGTVPFNWTTGDDMRIQFMYEAA